MFVDVSLCFVCVLGWKFLLVFVFLQITAYFNESKHLLALIKYRRVRSHWQLLLVSLVDFSEVCYFIDSPFYFITAQLHVVLSHRGRVALENTSSLSAIREVFCRAIQNHAPYRTANRKILQQTLNFLPILAKC